jgi:hypothetical protein
MRMKKIIVILDKGLVRAVRGIPKGFLVEVRDLDIQDEVGSHPCIKKTKDGEAWVNQWEP